MAKKPTQKQYENWIRNRLKKMQSNKLTQDEIQFYAETTLGKLTSELFSSIIGTSSKNNLIVRRTKEKSLEALEHAWNILKKVPTPSKLSQKTIFKHQRRQALANVFDYLYNTFTESEVQKILPERNEKGQFNEKDFQKLIKLREKCTTTEIQNMVDANESFFD